MSYDVGPSWFSFTKYWLLLDGTGYLEVVPGKSNANTVVR